MPSRTVGRSMASGASTLYQEGITGFNRFVDILAVEPEIVDAPDAIDLPTVREGMSLR
ncbi:MAG: hypothetical protein AAFV33_27155 [Chloroflexota bacterium]